MILVQLHPDVNRSDASSHTKFIQLNEAYSVLSNTISRHEYDLRLLRSRQACQHARLRHVESPYSQHSAAPDESYYRSKSLRNFCDYISLTCMHS